MKLRTLPFVLVVLLATGLLAVGCQEDPGGPVDPYPAPDFQLPDYNPRSPTWNQELSPADDALGKVLVLYFASFT
ncbi:MAG: hypothetical protein ABI333_00575 [bacterium]